MAGEIQHDELTGRACGVTRGTVPGGRPSRLHQEPARDSGLQEAFLKSLFPSLVLAQQ